MSACHRPRPVITVTVTVPHRTTTTTASHDFFIGFIDMTWILAKVETAPTGICYLGVCIFSRVHAIVVIEL